MPKSASQSSRQPADAPAIPAPRLDKPVAPVSMATSNNPLTAPTHASEPLEVTDHTSGAGELTQPVRDAVTGLSDIAVKAVNDIQQAVPEQPVAPAQLLSGNAPAGLPSVPDVSERATADLQPANKIPSSGLPGAAITPVMVDEPAPGGEPPPVVLPVTQPGRDDAHPRPPNNLPPIPLWGPGWQDNFTSPVPSWGVGMKASSSGLTPGLLMPFQAGQSAIALAYALITMAIAYKAFEAGARFMGLRKPALAVLTPPG